MNCNNCPLYGTDKQCFVHERKAYHYCDKLNPESENYKPSYLSVVQRKNGLLPTVLQTVKNATKAIIKSASTGFSTVPESIRKDRVTICEGCPELLTENRRCSVCSCFVDIKASVASEACPLKKWIEYTKPTNHVNNSSGECRCGEKI